MKAFVTITRSHLALLLAGAAFAGPARGEDDAPNPYGVCAHLPRGDERPVQALELQRMRDAGIGWARSDFSWSDIEPRSNQWSFAVYDETVAAAEKAGVKLLPILDYNVRWATPAHRNLGAWTNYVRATVDRYRDRLKVWEVWNEQNLDGFWPSPNPKDYTPLLMATWRTIKDLDPKLTVAFGGTSGVPLDYIEGVYRAGGGPFFDIMCVHPYRHPKAPETYLETELAGLRALMARRGDTNKPVWITEIGWPTHRAPPAAEGVLRAGLAALRPAQTAWNVAVLEDPGLPLTPPPPDATLRANLPAGATIRRITLDGLASLDPAETHALILPPDEEFAADGFDTILDYVRRGGIVSIANGAPLIYPLRRQADGSWKREGHGDDYRKRLHVAFEAWWYRPGIPKQVRPLAPAAGAAGIRVDARVEGDRFLTRAALAPGDRMIPLLYGSEGSYTGVVAAAYAFGGELKGGAVVSTLWEKRGGVNEDQQAEILPRAYLIALQGGVEKIFWYEFAALEENDFDPEHHFGMVHRDVSPKPAWQACRALALARPPGSIARPGEWKSGAVYHPQWTRPDGKSAGALWRTGSPRPCRVEFATRPASFTDHLGKPLRVELDGTAARLTLGDAPVYFIGGVLERVHEVH